jgi:hypothetical protein
LSGQTQSLRWTFQSVTSHKFIRQRCPNLAWGPQTPLLFRTDGWFSGNPLFVDKDCYFRESSQDRESKHTTTKYYGYIRHRRYPKFPRFTNIWTPSNHATSRFVSCPSSLFSVATILTAFDSLSRFSVYRVHPPSLQNSECTTCYCKPRTSGIQYYCSLKKIDILINAL